MKNAFIFIPEKQAVESWAKSAKKKGINYYYVEGADSFKTIPIHAYYFPTSDWYTAYPFNSVEILLTRLVTNWTVSEQDADELNLGIKKIKAHLQTSKTIDEKESFYQSLGMYFGEFTDDFKKTL